MFSKSIAAALVATALISGGASAQTNKPEGVRSNAAVHKDGAWRASKLVGVNVYNQDNTKIGDISDVILDRDGKAENVILGVGGFLGMGEHYVAVAYEKLKWVNEPVKSTTVSTSERTARPAKTADSTARTDANSAPQATTGIATARKNANNWYPDHAVLNATKDQLKAMPEFKY